MVVAVIFIALVVFALGICLFCFSSCFYSPNKKPSDPYSLLHGSQFLAAKEEIYASTRRMEEVPFEQVMIRSFDGLTLSGRYYHTADGAPVKIIFHGYRSMALRDCAGGFALARKLGMNVLAVDQRAHGSSGGHVIAFGILERRDCLSWIDYIGGRFGGDIPIVLSGLSMGAATVVMAASLPLPGNVQCVLADCPYASPKEIIEKACRGLGLPAKLIMPFIRIAARIFGGFSLRQASAIDAVGVSPVPILLLHGEDDRLVPVEMSRLMHQVSNGCTQLATFPNAGHGLSYMVDSEGYERTVIAFLEKIPALKQHIKNFSTLSQN